MKFAKLVCPLFLVASGLHGLALFLPTGGGADETAKLAVVEDTLAEGPQTDPTNQLSVVPDLNAAAESDVLVGTAPATIGAFNSVLPASQPAAIQPSVPVRPSVVAAAAKPRRMAAPVGPTSPAAAASTASSPPATTVMSTTPSSASTATDSPTSSTAQSETLAPILPVLSPSDSTSDQDSEDSKSTNVATNSSTEPLSNTADSATAPQPNTSLIASAITQLPDSLKSLMNRWAIALTYDPKGTGDRSAEAAKEKWTDTVNAQAGSSSIARLEPEQIENFQELSYPIESSIKKRGQAFRVCLAQPPSPAEIGILFDSQGEIIGEPEIIRSTGYDALNDEIVAIIKASENSLENRPSKAFIFEVAVDYDAQTCTSLPKLKKTSVRDKNSTKKGG